MNVVIVNGWAMPSSIWSEFCDLLKRIIACESCRVIDLDRSLNSNEWVQYLDNFIKPDTLLIGWSLGGMLAIEYAHQHPEKTLGLCTLQMNPKFVTGTDWPSAMAPSVFQEFKQLVEHDTKSDAKNMTKRFGFLVTTKGLDALGDLKKLKVHFSASSIPSENVLRESLELLGNLDVRNKLSTTDIPQLHIYGEHDQLVPKAAAKQIKVLSDQAHVELVEGISHLPCYSASKPLIKRIAEFAGDLN